jgi:ABC-2 type transport system permease protein
VKQILQVLPVILLAAVIAARMLRPGRGRPARTAARPRRPVLPAFLGDTGLVAGREIRQRIRGRVFRVGTLLILAAVAAAIVIPVLHRGQAPAQRVGVVGGLSAPRRAAVAAAGPATGSTARLVPERDVATARDGLRSGRLDLVIVGSRELLVDQAIGSASSSASSQFVRAVARTLGVSEAAEAAGLPAEQAARLARARPLPVASLRAPASGATRGAALAGLILVFLMLTQYNTWTLTGVIEEKSSRVAEVLLAAVRPAQLLSGKVLGIGVVAVAQAAVIAAFAVGLAQAAGSSLLDGTTPLVLAAALAWLLLGYGFYSWAYAAAGSVAGRQDQVQSLAFPLTIPIIFGYIMAFTVVGSGHPSAFFDVLAYLPPTAPFVMPVLVALGAVTWWEFAASAALSVLCTAGVARLAISIYRRSILRGRTRPGLARSRRARHDQS